MDVLELRARLIKDYLSYISSFIQILDNRIREYVERSPEESLLWPEALIQLSPSFESGPRIEEPARGSCTRNAGASSAPQKTGHRTSFAACDEQTWEFRE